MTHIILLVRYDDTWKRYDYTNNHSQYITQLTPELINNQESCKNFQEISRDENSSIPHFKHNIPDSDDENHIERDVPNLPWLLPQ